MFHFAVEAFVGVIFSFPKPSAGLLWSLPILNGNPFSNNQCEVEDDFPLKKIFRMTSSF